jgi:hypothetical protein
MKECKRIWGCDLIGGAKECWDAMWKRKTKALGREREEKKMEKDKKYSKPNYARFRYCF